MIQTVLNFESEYKALKKESCLKDSFHTFLKVSLYTPVQN